jgi:acyl carrier protein
VQKDEERLADHIRRHLSRDPSLAIGADTPLISSGLLDSLSLISVLAFIEDEFAVVIPDEAASAEAMDTVRRIVGLMDAYRPSAI